MWEKLEEEKRFELETDEVNGTINTGTKAHLLEKRKSKVKRSVLVVSFSHRKLLGIYACK